MKHQDPTDRLRCSLSVAGELVLHQMEELLQPGTDPRDVAPVMLWGPPGLGKSELLRSLAAAHGWDFVDVRLAQRDPVDLRGLPVPSGDVVRWLPSSDWPRADRPRGILLLDELTSADRALQVAAYELILDRRLGDSYALPPGWLVCGAGNRSEDASVSVPMSAALTNRFLHLDLEPDITPWLEWARANGVRADVVAYLRARPRKLLEMDRSDLQRGWPSPRSWARVSRFLDGAERGTRPLSSAARHAGLVGLVGHTAALEFERFLERAHALPDLVALLEGTQTLEELPRSPDVLHALVTGLAGLVWSRQDRAGALGVTLEIASTLPADFAALLYADMLSLAPPGASNDLLRHPALAALRARHGHLFAAPEPGPTALPAPGWQPSHRPRSSAA